MGARDAHLADWAARQFANMQRATHALHSCRLDGNALGKQSRASRGVHREIDAAAAFERLVRRVDDRIGGSIGNRATLHDDLARAELNAFDAVRELLAQQLQCSRVCLPQFGWVVGALCGVALHVFRGHAVVKRAPRADATDRKQT